MSLKQSRVSEDIGLMSFQFLYFSAYLCEEVGNGLRGYASEPVHKGIAWFCVEFDAGNACSVLSAVVLFFHKEVQLVEAVERAPLLLHVVGERLPEAYECEAAFMLDGITHNAKISAISIGVSEQAVEQGRTLHIYFFTMVPKDRWMLSQAWNSLSTMM